MVERMLTRLTRIGSQETDQETNDTIEHEWDRESLTMIVEQVFQKDDTDVDSRNDVNDQKRPFDGEENGVLVCHVVSRCCLLGRNKKMKRRTGVCLSVGAVLTREAAKVVCEDRETKQKSKKRCSWKKHEATAFNAWCMSCQAPPAHHPLSFST